MQHNKWQFGGRKSTIIRKLKNRWIFRWGSQCWGCLTLVKEMASASCSFLLFICCSFHLLIPQTSGISRALIGSTFTPAVCSSCSSFTIMKETSSSSKPHCLATSVLVTLSWRRFLISSDDCLGATSTNLERSRRRRRRLNSAWAGRALALRDAVVLYRHT